MKSENIELRQQLIRHQVGLKGVGVALAAFLILMVGLWPLFKSAGEMLRKINTRQKEADALSQKVAILSQIDQDVLKQRTQVIKQALPETKDVISYLNAVDGLSRELGLSFGGITIAPGEVGSAQPSGKSGKSSRTVGNLNVLDTDIKITGNRDGIYAFLRQVEQTLPLMQVTDVSVTSVSDGLYNMSLSLGMLWSPTPQTDLKGAITLFTEKEEEYFQKLSGFRTYSTTVPTIGNSPAGKANLFEQE